MMAPSHKYKKLALFMPMQTVWITGASSGLGEAAALRFAANGANLVLSARRENELKRVAGNAGLKVGGPTI